MTMVVVSGVATVEVGRHRDVDVVAVAELQAQVLALHRGAVADARDLQRLGEALGHAGHQLLHQRALHAPEGPRLLAVIGRLHGNAVRADIVADIVDHLQAERALRAL
jgi:hypothetical protein